MRLRTAASVVLLGLLAAGCGGNPGVPAQPAVNLTAPAAGLERDSAADAGPSWMSPDAKSIDLLYVVDLDAGAVDVYSYPSGKRKGRLKGFSAPHGACVDKSGDVFLTDGNKSEILEYAHGGTTPIQTLQDPNNFPHACSIDPVTGNLAVANSPLGSGGGSVSIYKKATGKGTPITVGNVFQVYFDGYDASGNLFVDGTDMHVAFEFAELPAGASTFTPITLNESINLPGQVQWDGTYLAVGDQVSLDGPSKIDEFTISGTTGTLEGTTQLSDSCDVLGFWIQGSTVIAPNDCAPNVKYFAYPAGGESTETISKKLHEPVGATVSLKQ
jgi:hypothetical protein